MELGEMIKSAMGKKTSQDKKQLYTVWGEQLLEELQAVDGSQPEILAEYPRPQMKRDNYRILNGWWSYAFTGQDSEKPEQWDGQILVPFSPESVLSGVKRQLMPDQSLWYEREILLTEEERQSGKRLLLHFGAVDQSCQVWWNDTRIGEHQCGYLPFTFDVTELMQEKNVLRLQVWDDSDTGYHARGKQMLKPGGMFYTAQSGIWQTVWMEWVPQSYIERLKLTPDYDKRSVKAEMVVRNGADGSKKKVVQERRLTEEEFHPWTPEDPYLYDWEITEGEDVVQTYFAMRCFTTEKDEKGILRLCLNHQPYFQHGVLDQGYWPDGLMTAPSDEAFIYDIECLKKAGFNMIRKHIKIEPLRWYYHCDRLGMLVWQDMVNGGGKYEPVKVTYIPTFIPAMQEHMNDHIYRLFARENLEGRKEWLAECRETVKHLYNCPSICLWVPFNEGWGQFDSLKVVDMIRELDDTRWIDHASGWADQGGGDVKSIHNYFSKLEVKPDKKNRPVVYSEYGGYACYIQGHSYANQVYGYRHYETIPEFREAYEKLQNRIHEMIEDGLCAGVYTQVSDIEDEVNGFLTYDRKVNKLGEEN